MKLLWIGIGLSILIAGIVVLSVLGGKIAWWQWQHIIGAIGGALLFGGLVISSAHLSFDSVGVSITCLITSFVILAVSIPLAYSFGNNYSIIFYWLSGYLALWAIGTAFYAFSDVEEGFGMACIVDIIILGIVVVMYLFIKEWWQWQHFIGAVGGLCLYGILFFIMGAIFDDGLYLPGVFVFGALIIANCVLTLVFKADYKIISFWINGFSILTCSISAFCAFDDVEGPFGGVLIGEALLAIGSVIATASLL